MYENLKLLIWAIMVVVGIGGVGALIDVFCILAGRKITRAKKWIWNIVEMAAIWFFIGIEAVDVGIDLVLHGLIYLSAWFMWRIIHDGFIGLGIADDFLYVGKGAWDSKMLAAYQGNKWLYFIINKCFPLGILLAGFLTN